MTNEQKRMSKRPKFSQDQIDWICYQIGDWYMEWRNKITTGDGHVHRLGIAKKQLKTWLCGDGSEEFEYKSFAILVYDYPVKYTFKIAYLPAKLIIHNSVEQYETQEKAVQAAKIIIDTMEG